ncbi:MAG: RIP metalloprotease RseP [Bacteroidota bacterium]
MEYLIIIAQFILSLSILIVLHEMGHFLPARLFGTRVEKFYLFFNPWFSLFKKQIGETEYGIGWLPLGGYVKISGMMDESFDKEQMALPPQPYEFRSKPAWQRLIIMVGGVTVNFILGFLLWGMVLFIWGDSYLPTENVKYGVYVDDLAKEIGLQNGDKIISVDGKPMEKFGQLKRDLIINQAATIQVDRKGQQVDVSINDEQRGKLTGRNVMFAVPRTPFVAAKVIKDSPAKEAGIEKGDSIIALNGTPTLYFDQFKDMAKGLPDNDIEVTLVREGQTQNIQVRLDSCGRMGVQPFAAARYLETASETYGLGTAMGLGFSKGVDFLMDNIKGFALMFTGDIKPSDGLGGFGTIANLFPKQWEWERFWTITAILSLILAFMNLLPIPLLDGGHVMFLIYEMIAGKAPNEKFLEYAQTAGLVILMALLLYANGMDVYRSWFMDAPPCS